MPHGDFSDMAAFFCGAAGLAAILKPDVYFTELAIPGTEIAISPFFVEGDTTTVLKFCGGLLVFMFLTLFTVRWNTTNGKAGGLGCFIVSGISASIAGEWELVKMGHVVALVFALSGLHLMFNANPMHTAASLKAKEDEKAKKGK